MNSLKERAWSPYAAGVLIGLLQIPAFLLAGTALGVSSSFVTVAASMLSFVDPTALAVPYFKSHVSSAKALSSRRALRARHVLRCRRSGRA